jgi:hypothetical protein
MQPSNAPEAASSRKLARLVDLEVMMSATPLTEAQAECALVHD